MANNIRLYFHYIRMQLSAGVEYKGWWLMALQVLLVVICDPIGTVFLFSRFGSIGVWSFERILLIYAMAITSIGLAETFFRGFDVFPWRMLRTGDFDRLLLRPRSLFVQVSGSFFHIHRMARAAAGLAVIFWSLARLHVPLNIMNACILILALTGGMLMYCGIFVLTSGIAFFTIKGLDWIYILTNASSQVTRCPVEYLPRFLYRIFLFLVPLLAVSYYPASAMCGWGEPLFTGFLALPAGLAFLGFSQLFWHFGVRHYKSCGS